MTSIDADRVPGQPAKSRVTALHTPEQAAGVRKDVTEGWALSALVKAEAVKLTADDARYHGWEVNREDGETLADLVGYFLPPEDGEGTFESWLNAHGDEQLITYVLGAELVAAAQTDMA